MSRICAACGHEIRSPKTMYCECDACRHRWQHIEQCGSCGDLAHRQGPRQEEDA